MRDDTCAAPGCVKTRYLSHRSRYCTRHLSRLRRSGSLADPPRRGPFVETNGYVKIGRRYVHRDALMQKIGPGPAPCRTCSSAYKANWRRAKQTQRAAARKDAA